MKNVCGNGTCSNVEGGFECSCNDGFAPGPMQVIQPFFIHYIILNNFIFFTELRVLRYIK